MNAQLLEHEQHEAGCASELQNCYAEAGQVYANAQVEQGKKIAAAIAAGRFVVVSEDYFHCRATDAVVGTILYFVKDFATREEAATYAADENNRTAAYADFGCTVLPELPPAPVAPVATEKYEVPF